MSLLPNFNLHIWMTPGSKFVLNMGLYFKKPDVGIQGLRFSFNTAHQQTGENLK